MGDVIKDRLANTLWETLDDVEAAIGEELKPICETAERVRSLASNGWLVDQVNATVTENSTVTCYKWYDWVESGFILRVGEGFRRR